MVFLEGFRRRTSHPRAVMELHMPSRKSDDVPPLTASHKQLIQPVPKKTPIPDDDYHNHHQEHHGGASSNPLKIFFVGLFMVVIGSAAFKAARAEPELPEEYWDPRNLDVKDRNDQRTSIMSTKKIVNLIEFPPVALLGEHSANKEIHYLELWMRSTQPHHDSPSGRTSLPQELKSNLMNIPVRLPWGNPLVTPGSSGVEFRSIPISGSGHDFPSHSAEANSVRKTCGMGTGCKLKFHCRKQKWADKAYKKPRLGNKWACPFAGTSHAKGSVLKKIGLEVEAKQPSDIGKCARAQLTANKCAQRWLFELH